jgi:hypothetical protein
MGRPAEALPLHRRVLGKQIETHGPDNVVVAVAQYQVAQDLLAIGKEGNRAEARSLLEASLATLEKRSPPHWRTPEVRSARAGLGPAAALPR